MVVGAAILLHVVPAVTLSMMCSCYQTNQQHERTSVLLEIRVEIVTICTTSVNILMSRVVRIVISINIMVLSVYRAVVQDLRDFNDTGVNIGSFSPQKVVSASQVAHDSVQ